MMIDERFMFIANNLFRKDPLLGPRIDKMIKEREEYEQNKNSRDKQVLQRTEL